MPKKIKIYTVPCPKCKKKVGFITEKITVFVDREPEVEKIKLNIVELECSNCKHKFKIPVLGGAKQKK